MREARQDIRLQQAISKDATEWEQRNKPGDRLYRGSQLKEAKVWAARNLPSSNEVAFLQASASYRVRSLVSLIVMFLLLVSSMGITGWFLTHQPPKPPDPTRVTNLQDNVIGSLRWAITNAPSGSTITFAPGLRGIIVLSSDLIIAKKSLSIRGPGARIPTISTYGINVRPGASIRIFDLAFTGSKFNAVALVQNYGTLTLTNSAVSDNTASISQAGGIVNWKGTLTLINSTVSDNTAPGQNSNNGGGIGGGILNDIGRLTLINSTVSGNSASGQNSKGGGIFNLDGTLTLISSTVSGNSVSGQNSYGGGIFNLDGNADITNSTVSGNATSGQNSEGGGIFSQGGTLTLTNSTVSGNSASGQNSYGGGIFNADGNADITNSTVSGNAAFAGGGVSNYNDGKYKDSKLNLTNSTISDNSASQGGGIDNVDSILTLTNSTISGNSASGQNNDGGGIFNLGSKVDISFCTIYGNTSEGFGGGISTQDDPAINPPKSSQLVMRNTFVAGNRAHIGPDIAGTLTSAGYNLIQNFTGATFIDPLKMHHTDISGDKFPNLGIDPTLRDNGGSTNSHTRTHALLPGSPAIDAIPLQYCQVKDILNSQSRMYTDQRGMKRPDENENKCDIGAYESSP